MRNIVLETKWRKISLQSCWIFLTTPDEAEKYVEIIKSNSSDKYLRHYNIKISNIFDTEIQAKTKNYAFEYWIVLDVIVKHSTKPVPIWNGGEGSFWPPQIL